ncbi:MAG: SusC/RagA family TonB-linked outer membrane protein [Bacteroidaceae bacterium]|nr:SusC/RagA family TonB-linked outer membrane protein [Bacteroidaceae bacterium]
MNNISLGKNRIGALLLTVLMCMVSGVTMAQGIRISGTVNDEMGPVMMANVVERDGNNRIINATTTDFNGNFAMAIKSTKNKLVVSYVGNKTHTEVIGNKKVFKIFMESETQLQEIVVKAEKKSSVGGLNIPVREMTVATQTFNMEDVEGLSFTSADEALQGEIAGLDIVANSGNLGAGTQMRLRGVTTINGDANPLIVVDDKIFDNPDENFDFQNATDEQYASLLSVNVDDIAKIDVLKDAAATAIWGAYGANGVIQITTKRGVRGKTKVNFSYKFTGTWMPKGYKLLNGDDYTMMLKEEFYNPSQSSTATANINELNYNRSWAEYENWNNNTDWVKEVSDFGKLHNFNLNITGGGEKARFRISGSYDHQSGSIIKQRLDRLTTRLVLDYDVSDRIRFSTNFALTYTNNQKNFTDLLAIAQAIYPNMAVYRQNADGSDTDEYYHASLTTDQLNLTYKDKINGESLTLISPNPVAIANKAWKKESTYRITPDFTLRYELLGKDADQHRLTLSANVDFDIYANSSPSWFPADLADINRTGTGWTTNTYNVSGASESNRFKIGAEGKLQYVPHFNNENWSAMAMLRYQMHTSKSNGQTVTMRDLPSGIISTTAEGAYSAMASSTSRSADENILFNAHASYKSIYSLGFSMRMDGSSKFGPSHKWAAFPGVSGRWNIIDEKFIRSWMPEVVSMLAVRASYGINGRAPTTDYLVYNKYSTSAGYYGNGTDLAQYAAVDGMKLDDLRWEKTTSINIGGNLNFFEDRLAIDFDYYRKNTSDLLMTNVKIPGSTGYSALSWYNAGKMTNNGWELNISGRDFVKIGKDFSISVNFNIAQNVNNIKEMDDRVLSAINSKWDSASRGTYLNRIQEGNPLGSIYGLRYKGVYQYTYSYLENYRKENSLSTEEYRAWINEQIDEGKTFPVALDANGHVLMTNQGTPQRMVYNYDNGSPTYEFNGGDAIYEDVNNDGQINALDVVYLGNAMPKFNGGFSLTFKYKRWKLVARFNYRAGNKIVNAARMNLENMYTANNQTATVNYRWRKDGDSTPIPRALRGTGYNWQGSSRYVEDGSFLRFQNLQLSYSFPQKPLKKLGISSLALYFSMNNLYCWTKYSGVDPEVSIGGWGVATDNSKTPRSKQFTASLNIGF